MKKKSLVSSLDELHLFQSQKIHLKNSMDRYGFSYLLADSIGISKPKRSFCDWVHGWVWWEDLMEPQDILGAYSLPTDVSIVVGTNNQKKLFLDYEFKNDIYLGGLPYAYCPELNIPKCKNVLLSFLPHSADGQQYEVIDLHYLDYLHSIKDNWESIFVSIFYLDESEKLISEIERRGLKVIIGANPSDKYSMLRTKLMFTLADAVNSNVMGSHIAYALASNCKVSLVDDLHIFDSSVTSKGNPHLSKKDIDRSLFVTSFEYLQEKFKYLFVDPSQGVRNEELGKEYIGFENLLESKELKKAIGWNFLQQLNGFTMGLHRRIKRKLNASS
jgi:hypothetical protein